jgi:HK97 family phage portal protein
MTAALFDLQATSRPSRVLSRWMADGGARGGSAADAAARVYGMSENSVATNWNSQQLAEALGLANATASGVHVTADAAMRVSTVYACVALISGAVASLPVGIFERVGDDRQRADHDYKWWLNESACDEFTAAAAWEYIVTAKLFYGDGYAELLRPSFGSSRITGMRPMHPQRTQAFRSDGQVFFRHMDLDGRMRVLSAADVLHFPSLGFDGLESPSPITYAAREAIGTAIAAETFNGQFFTDGATFDYALKTPQALKKEQIEDLRTSLAARVRGNGRSRAPLILSGGLEPAPLSISPRDAEVLGTRLLSVQEICRALGVPPHMVGHTEKTTSWGSGIEQQGMGFVRYTLQRHLTPIAQELNRKLWPTRARYFVEHITAALERGDVKARYEAYRVALGRAGERPFMTVGEVRRLENMRSDDSLNQQAKPAHTADPSTTDTSSEDSNA